MIGETNSGAGGIKANGGLASYTVASGYTVNIGDFVAIESEDDATVYPATVRICGVASTNGAAGEAVYVYIPVSA